MTEAFYHPLGDGRFASSEHTAGPWLPENQHLGPPGALLTRELERCDNARGMLLARITIEVLGPVPIAELRVSARVERTGKSVEMLAATLATSERTVAQASAWRIARGDSSSQSAGAVPELAPVSQGTELLRPERWLPGYIDAMEWRGLRGSFTEYGPATVWARQGVPLVAGERPSPLQRLMTVADSGSGVSNRLHPTHWLFINTEITVHIQREPVGEWIGLDANTVIGPEGVGTAVSVLHDERGQVGNAAQALLVRQR